MSLRPLGQRILVERIEEQEKVTPGGIIIPDSAKEKPTQGMVIAVGPGGRDKEGKRIPMDIKAGDLVVFGKWGGNEIKIEGKEYLLLKEDDIYGIIE
ncbi:MAG: co-chaperone GroES [Candidatus Thermoplasmatota archaeon]|nr:co-chaperone GroES [Candidatus Thermoplasmatota archaeon]MDP7266109.1 co-chaperone GroES [Candidatus Thermoplasmatota archaeon]